MNEAIIAHRTLAGELPVREQSLLDHSLGVYHLMRDQCNEDQFKAIKKLIAFSHDIGKASDEGQKRMKGGSVRVNHSGAGGKEIYEGVHKKSYWKVLAFPGLCHHGGLVNTGSKVDGQTTRTLWSKLNADIPDYKHKVPAEIMAEISNSIDDAIKEINTYSKLLNSEHYPDLGFHLSLLIRYLFSCLVDADYLDTEAFFNQHPRTSHSVSFEDMSVSVDKMIEAFNSNPKGLNQLRTQILNNCVNKATLPSGLFTLSAPTGAGKTESSLAFAVNHARYHNKDRIIYAVPYNTITLQTSERFRAILGNNSILEHHSDFDFKEGDENTDQCNSYRLLLENWDASFIVTSTVQLFESLFGCKNAKVRKVHNIYNSVIVLDEAQLIPVDLLEPTLKMIEELVKYYNCTVVMMTATNPNFPKVIASMNQTELLDDPVGYHEKFKKVDFSYIGECSMDRLVDRISPQHQALCIVNTKKAALSLYNCLKETNQRVYYLTTNLCPVDRKQVILEIKNDLKQNRECIVISTSLIEAGVDLDFPVVYREIAGLDSIIQAGGRCNREGKLVDENGHLIHGKTYIYKFNAEDFPLPAYIKTNAAVTEGLLHQDINSLECIQAYFTQLYKVRDTDKKGILPLSVVIKQKFQIDFESIAKKYKIIGNDSYSIIINKPEAEELIKEFEENPTRELQRKLQPYTISVYADKIDSLTNLNVLDVIGSNIYLLNNYDYYDFDEDTRTGLKLDIDNSYVF